MPKTVSAKEKTQTLGYPVLENMIETEPATIPGFNNSRAALNDLAHKAKRPEDKAHARQALLAYERFQHFFEEMIRLRDKLIRESLENQPPQDAAEKTKKKPSSRKK